MPSLSASNSLFELSFGVNAVLPALFAGFHAVKEKAAESLLRKLKEVKPGFEIRERDIPDFIDFHFKSSRGLRHAKYITYITAFISLSLCATSLAALCWSAENPNFEVPSKYLYAFVGLTLVAAPIFYWLRDRYLQWLYSAMVIHGTNNEVEALVFADCVNLYLAHKKEWEPLEQEMNAFKAELPFLIWKMRLMRFEIWLMSLWRRLCSNLPFKRTR